MSCSFLGGRPSFTSLRISNILILKSFSDCCIITFNGSEFYWFFSLLAVFLGVSFLHVLWNLSTSSPGMGIFCFSFALLSSYPSLPRRCSSSSLRTRSPESAWIIVAQVSYSNVILGISQIHSLSQWWLVEVLVASSAPSLHQAFSSTTCCISKQWLKFFPAPSDELAVSPLVSPSKLGSSPQS